MAQVVGRAARRGAPAAVLLHPEEEGYDGQDIAAGGVGGAGPWRGGRAEYIGGGM